MTFAPCRLACCSWLGSGVPVVDVVGSILFSVVVIVRSDTGYVITFLFLVVMVDVIMVQNFDEFTDLTAR